MSTSSRTTGWVGWIWFAAIVMITVGIMNIVDGVFAATSDAEWIVVGSGEIGVFDLSTWGWVHIVLGSLLALVGFCLMAGRKWARWVAVVLVVLNTVAQFVVMPATPWWSLVTIALDIFVLWALIIHGDEAEKV